PGECPGTYALECAMDELSYSLGIDPVALRLANHADNHPTKSVPWQEVLKETFKEGIGAAKKTPAFSAKHLKECYSLGAEKFGWAKRNPKPAARTRLEPSALPFTKLHSFCTARSRSWR